MEGFKKNLQGFNIDDFNVSSGGYGGNRYPPPGGVSNCQGSQNCLQGGGWGPVSNCQGSQNCFQGGGWGPVSNCQMSQNCLQSGGWGPISNCQMSQNCFYYPRCYRG